MINHTSRILSYRDVLTFIFVVFGHLPECFFFPFVPKFKNEGAGCNCLVFMGLVSLILTFILTKGLQILWLVALPCSWWLLLWQQKRCWYQPFTAWPCYSLKWRAILDFESNHFAVSKIVLSFLCAMSIGCPSLINHWSFCWSQSAVCWLESPHLCGAKVLTMHCALKHYMMIHYSIRGAKIVPVSEQKTMKEKVL